MSSQPPTADAGIASDPTKDKKYYISLAEFMNVLQDRGVQDDATPEKTFKFTEMKKSAAKVARLLKKEQFRSMDSKSNVTSANYYYTHDLVTPTKADGQDPTTAY